MKYLFHLLSLGCLVSFLSAIKIEAGGFPFDDDSEETEKTEETMPPSFSFCFSCSASPVLKNGNANWWTDHYSLDRENTAHNLGVGSALCGAGVGGASMFCWVPLVAQSGPVALLGALTALLAVPFLCMTCVYCGVKHSGAVCPCLRHNE